MRSNLLNKIMLRCKAKCFYVHIDYPLQELENEMKGEYKEKMRRIKLKGKPRRLLILCVCILPLLLLFCIQVPIVRSENWWNSITIREDLNIDFKVNILDLVLACKAYASTPISPNWNPYCDINKDKRVDILDIASIAMKYGWQGTMPSHTTLTVSSTTSLYETGVEDAMKQAFQAEYPWITINFLSQGTGIALQTAMRGDADMVMVHSPSQELPFMTGGYGVNRKIIAYNFFVIVGPPNDPANITGMSPLDALKKIKTLGESGQAIWVSRGDNSGTNTKEKSLWAAAGISWAQIRTETSWYKETGQGMTATLLVANELGGYTLSDTASFLTNTKAGNINMTIVIQDQKDLLNVYSCIADNPLNANLTQTNFVASMLFIYWLCRGDGQNLLATYGTSTFGAPLFSPFLPLVSTGSNATLLSWIQNYAYFNGTECPPAYRYDSTVLYANVWDGY
jgi:tungstate transport system substrate-binding protein